MTKRMCMRIHYPESICMVERIVLFHNTRFRIAMSVHEYYCQICRKTRDVWFIS